MISKKEIGNVLKDYMERIMNEENDWDHDVEGDSVEGPVDCVHREEVLQALTEMNTAKAPGLSQVSLELFAASWGVGIQAMTEISQKVLHEFRMSPE